LYSKWDCVNPERHDPFDLPPDSHLQGPRLLHSDQARSEPDDVMTTSTSYDLADR
jgi:hypothetical protein